MVSRRQLALALVVGLGFAGCANPARVEKHWGEAQQELVNRMVENPEAEQAPPAPVEGLDPLTGEAVTQKYEEGQGESREPSQLPSIIQIETGSGR
jgi:hypothetical protein